MKAKCKRCHTAAVDDAGDFCRECQQLCPICDKRKEAISMFTCRRCTLHYQSPKEQNHERETL